MERVSSEGAGSQESVKEQAKGGVCVCVCVAVHVCQPVSQPFRQEEAKPGLFSHGGPLLSEKGRERLHTRVPSSTGGVCGDRDISASVCEFFVRPSLCICACLCL